MVATSGKGWKLAPSLIALFDEVDERYPKRSKVSDGSIGDAAHASRTSDHNPNAQGWVTAGDVTHDPEGGFDSYTFAESLRVRRDPRVKYVISNGRIFTSYAVTGRAAWVWGSYSGSNPHTRHVHISVLNTHAGLHNTSSWFPLDAPKPKPKPTSPAKAGSLLKVGSTGPAVRSWQRRVRAETGRKIAVDGVYGSVTASATRDLQIVMRITVDGIVGQESRTAMNFLEARSIAGLTRGMRGAKVALLQRRLNEYAGAGLKDDGIYGKKTQAAVKNFQKFFKLSKSPTGLTAGPKTNSMLAYIIALNRM